jgi:acyl-CoA synthetase (AMP-forming)/AMP-acid ligase II
MPATICRRDDFAVLARRFDDRVAVADISGEITYRALMGKAAALGARLVEAGVRPGEPVASFVRNGIPAVWTSIGIIISGAAEAGLNPGLSKAERRYCMELARIGQVVTSAGDAPFFRELGAQTHVIEEIGSAELSPQAFPRIPLEAWARIGFTSGTTGTPKGIVTNQRARFTANLLQRAAMPTRPGPASRLLLMTPFPHGASLLTHAYLELGGSVLLLDGVDPATVLGILERHEVDEMFAPPTVLAKIVAAGEGRRFPDLKTIYCGTAVLSPTLYARAKAIFGPVIRVTYGKSEVVNPITVLDAAETDAWYAEGGPQAGACVGWPASGVEIVIKGEDGRSASQGEPGEVLIRAAQMLAGTLRADGYTPLDPDAFHETGDLGFFDSRGRLHLSGRAADVIKTGGYKVAPEEIERTLAAALGKGEFAVCGLPSEYWGEVIVAVAERPPPGWQDRLAEAISAMTSYKRPRALIAVDELPRNAMLKVSRKAVRERLLATHRLIDGPRPVLEPIPRSAP